MLYLLGTIRITARFKELEPFKHNIPVYYIYDVDNILDDKESPCDNFDKFQYLIKNNMYTF